MNKTIVTGVDGYVRDLGEYGSHYYFWEHILKVYRGNVVGKNFLEIGCTRQIDYKDENYWKLFDSSGFFYNKSIDYQFNFTGVDMDTSNINSLKNRFGDINVLNETGEDFTMKNTSTFDFLYLDAFDYEKSCHPKQRREKYDLVLNAKITNENCWKMHLTCCENILPNLSDSCLICFDDIFDENTFEGKGKLAIPFLLDNGFVVDYYQKSPGPPMMILKREDV